MAQGSGKTLSITAATVVLLGLITFIVVDEQRRGTQNAPIVWLAPELASNITIERADEIIVLEKQAQAWQVTQPVQAAANEQRVRPLLALLTAPHSTPYPVDQVDLEALGLATPTATITINGIAFVFGGPGPGERQRYLMTNGQVYLTRDIVLPLVSGGTDALIAAQP